MQLEAAVHLLAYLETRLDTDLDAGLAAWQHAFAQARTGWQLSQARQLLQILKKYPLSRQQRAVVRTLEGQLWAQQGEWSEAAAAYDHSLALWPEQVGALSGLGNALRRLEGRAPEAVACFQRALDLADEAARPGILNNLGLAYYEAGQLDEAQEVLQQAQAAYHAVGDHLTEATVLHNLGSLAWTRGRLREAEAYFGVALAIYRDADHSHALAETLNSLGLVQEANGRWAEAAVTYRQALTLLQQDRDDYGRAQTLANLGNALTLLQQFAEAATCFQSGLLIARDLGEARLEGQLLNGLAEWQQAQGHFEAAAATFQAALARKEAGGDRRSLKHTWLSLATLYRNMKRPSEAQPAYEQALALARAQADRRVEAHALLGLARLARVQSQLDNVAPDLDAAHELAQAEHYSEVLAEVAHLRGDLEILQPDPDYHRLLMHYSEALAYARDFNELTLQEMADYLTDLIQAIAADGQPREAAQMAGDIGRLAAEVKLPAEVTAVFVSLAHSLLPSSPTTHE
jgi:tetratricopeptide (TPR) repeat protein